MGLGHKGVEMESPDMETEEKDQHYSWRPVKKVFSWLTLGASVLWLLGMIVFSRQVIKATEIISKDLKDNIVYVHDTVLVKIKMPATSRCWDCHLELIGILNGPVKCCKYEYEIINGKLTARNLEE
jgi:hypothetical protein